VLPEPRFYTILAVCPVAVLQLASSEQRMGVVMSPSMHAGEQLW
jgi:hypothetical protein